jgi:hypothetical protein
MLRTVRAEHNIRVLCRPQRLGGQVPLVPRVLLTHLFDAVGSLASVCSRLVAPSRRYRAWLIHPFFRRHPWPRL